jgi:hypothetical protein
MQATIEQAGLIAELAPHASALKEALRHVGAATRSAWATGNPTDALANAVPYLQAFGHTVLAWIWLDVALASRANAAGHGEPCAHRPPGRRALLLPLRTWRSSRSSPRCAPSASAWTTWSEPVSFLALNPT